MKYWQVAAGEGARNYSSVFLEFGIMLIGSGSPGPVPERLDWYKKNETQAIAFAYQVQPGDVVVLKRPYHKEWQILAVGRVTGDYEYLEQFDDVEGWDLQHSRKVEWVLPKDRLLVKGLTFGTFRRIHRMSPMENIQQVFEEGEKQEARGIPAPARKISDEDLVESLIGKGLRPADAETVIQTIWRVRRLARWYTRYGRDLSEHEIRTFLIVPILLALGWSEQKIKIEWKNTDMSFFREVYTRGGKPSMILESKRIGEGLHYAERQLVKYTKMFPECIHLVASDGLRYQLYRKHGSEWNLQQDFNAYANLLNLKIAIPIWST
jgi:hypothetical protein